MKKLLCLLAAVMLLCAVSVTASAQTDDPVLYYSFENADAKNIRDDSPSKNQTGLGSGITFAPGRVGNAAVFDGESDIIVTMDELDSFTVAFFLKCDSISANGGQLCGNAEWSNNTVHIVYGFNGRGLRANFNGFVNSDSSVTDTGIQVELDDMTQYDGQWIHVAITYDNDTLERTLYINGAVAASDKSADKLSGTINGDFYIGAWNNDRFFTGMLDEFRIYGRAITADEVAALAAQSGEGLVDPGEVTTSAPTETPTASDETTAPAGGTTAPAGETTGQATQNADRPSDETQNGFPWTIVIICAAVLALAVVVFLIAKRKPDNKE